MRICVLTPTEQFRNDILDVVRVFEGSGVEAVPEEEGAALLRHTEETCGNIRRVRVEFLADGQKFESGREGPVRVVPLEDKRIHKRLIKQSVYDVCVSFYGRRPPWGSLTGIRPTRLVYMAMDRGLEMEEAAE